MKRPFSPPSTRFLDVAVSIVTEQPSSTMALRVVLVDARAERRQLMRHVVEGTEAGATVVAEADNEAAALLLVEQHNADAVVLDIQMPIQQGLETITSLRSGFAQLAIVVCSFHLDGTTQQRALAEGADVYLAKPISPRQLNAVIRRVWLEKTISTP